MIALIVLLSLTISGVSAALPYKRLFAFGDSWVDDNASPFSNWQKKHYPPSPPMLYRWSNGPTFAGHLARSLGVDCDFSNDTTEAGIRCDNYINVAEGGACSKLYEEDSATYDYCSSNGTLSSPFHPDQVNNFKGLVDKDDIKSDTDLFLISIGGNDANGLIGADDGFIEKLGNVIDHGHEVIDAIVEGVKTLHGYGARHFVLVNVPPALITPRALEQLGRSGVKREVADEFLEDFSESYANKVEDLREELDGVTIFHPNLRGCLREKDVGLYNSFAGFSETEEACIQNRFEEDQTVCDDPSEYFWFDDIHPTTKAHELIGNEIFKFIESDDPERDDLCMASSCYGDSIFDKCFEKDSELAPGPGGRDRDAGSVVQLSFALIVSSIISTLMLY